MGFSEKPAVWTDREPTLDEELRALGEDDLVEMAYLPPDYSAVGTSLLVEYMGEHYPVTVTGTGALFDPKNERITG